MNEMRFSIKIDATKKRVWDTLWQDETFREWASIIDPEIYMIGSLKQGGEVQFISAANGYGVTSLVEKLVIGEVLILRHRADTQKDGKQKRENEWSGGAESYSLAEKDSSTTLTVVFDVPSNQEKYFKVNYPLALERVKVLAERTN
jgi:hypothetical protein